MVTVLVWSMVDHGSKTRSSLYTKTLSCISLKQLSVGSYVTPLGPFICSNRTDGVMVTVLVWSMVDHGSKTRSCQTKDYKIGICCFSSKHAALRRKSKNWQNQESLGFFFGEFNKCIGYNFFCQVGNTCTYLVN
jgi:hypothetical protein